jgi:hypothetical protein
MLHVILAACLLFVPAPASAPTADLKEIKAQFEALHQKDDRAGCVALWKANPSAVLPVIDQDLEGSLKLWERSKEKPDTAKIATMHTRALWGARAAAEATGHPILVEYASSFVGWNDAQKASFRGGQKAFGAAMKALQGKDAKAALESARECSSKALPLGDWWGAAMGWDAEGNAQRALGAGEAALAAFTQARIAYHDLGLAGDEYQALTAIVELCQELGRPARGCDAADQAIALAKSLGDKDGEAALAKKRADLEAKLGGAPAK